jgi:hypothetical protein
MSISIDSTFNALAAHSDKMEKNLAKMIENLGDNPSTADLQKLTLANTKYSIMTQLQSNTLKSIGETLKSVVGNLR